MKRENTINTGTRSKDNKSYTDERVYKELAEQSPLGLLVCDMDGCIHYANKRVAELMGAPSIEETLKINLFSFPKLIEIGVADKMQSYIESGRDKMLDVHYVSKWGSELWIKINIIPIRTNNHVEGARIIIDDMTEFMHHQQKITKNEQHFRVLFEHLGDAIWIIDREGRINYVNEKACLDSGYSKSELMGVEIHELDDKIVEGDFANSFDAIQKKGYIHHMGKSIHKSGELIDIEVHAVCLEFDNKPLVVCSINNISEQRMKEQELLFEKEKADLARKAKTHFLSNISHEIRTPINGIMGFLQMLKSTTLDEEQLEYLQWMKSSTDSLLKIIDDIIDMSNIETKKLCIQEKSFSLIELFDESMDIVRIKAEEKNIQLRIHIMDSLPERVNGDSFRVQQVVVSLLDNAIKFTEQGQVTLYVKLDVDKEQRCLLDIIVEDTGIGIDSKQLERLFEPFEQYDLSLTRKYGGTGLGLTISKALVELMHGSISVKSQLGIGTKIHLMIPLNRGE